MRLWNAENGGSLRQFGENKDFVYTVAASADGTIVAAGGEEGIVRLYNGQNGQLVKAMLPPEAGKTAPSKKEAGKESKKK